MVEVYDKAKITALFDDLHEEGWDDEEGVQLAIEAMNRWLDRGDGIAIYRNEDLGDPEAGHIQFVSYGSSECQLDTNDPPQRLPDIGNQINWRYQLVGTYKGEKL